MPFLHICKEGMSTAFTLTKMCAKSLCKLHQKIRQMISGAQTIPHWACCPSVSGVIFPYRNMKAKWTQSMFNTQPWLSTHLTCEPCLPCQTHYLEPVLKTTQVCLFTKRSETLHMYPQMTLPRTVLWNCKVCSLVSKIMPPDLLGKALHIVKIVIHQGFQSSIILNQKRIRYELHTCWSIVPQGTKRPKHANTRLTHASPYILGVWKVLQPMSNYFWNPDIFWQHAISYGLYLAMFNFFPQNMATLCSFSPNDLCWIHFICCQVAIFRPKKNNMEQGSFVSILWYQKFGEFFQQIRKISHIYSTQTKKLPEKNFSWRLSIFVFKWPKIRNSFHACKLVVSPIFLISQKWQNFAENLYVTPEKHIVFKTIVNCFCKIANNHPRKNNPGS
jgi:hypothetical protein